MNAMNNNPSISVEIIPGGRDSDGHETYEVNFVGDAIGDDPQPVLRSKARVVWFGPKVVFIVVESAQFENIPDENKVELLLMVPRGLARLQHINGEMVAVFSDELVEEVPYLLEISTSTDSIADCRMALPNFIDEADQNLLARGYYFHPAPLPPREVEPLPEAVAAMGSVAEGFEKVPVDIAGGSTPAAAPVASSESTDTAEEAATPALPVKKMKIGFDEKQLMMVGNSVAALGEAITVDFRHKTNGEKFEVAAIDTIQTIGIEMETALGLTYGALALTNRFTPELPLELGLTKSGHEELITKVSSLEEKTKWNSHLNLFLIDGEYVKAQVALAAEQGYVADLEE